ncbi:MAG: hypothetical protein AB1758_37650 [Candidatus Eremiobacterota bacterium]
MFNVVHLASGFKVDVYRLGRRDFDRCEFGRVVMTVGGRETWTATPELDWYRLGGEVSERQWKDLMGVLRVWSGRLDPGYLKHWSAQLGVSDVLQRALDEL